MPIAKVLLVDDDQAMRTTLAQVLEMNNFEVTVAANIPEALKKITSEIFDVLLTDLHMPGAGDGLTAVSAMRHANPKAVTLILSAFPDMDVATQTILLQADEILAKPMDVASLIDVITQRLARGPAHARLIESVAAILERSTQATIQDWYSAIEKEKALMAIPMTQEQRCGHLPQLFRDLVYRLRRAEDLGTKELVSASAIAHGIDRRKRGYTAAMMVEESRMLQVNIFRTLQKNLPSIDFSILLTGVMTIADEVDSQLSQAMKSYTAESTTDALPPNPPTVTGRVSMVPYPPTATAP